MEYSVRKAAKKDIPRLLELLVQVDMVHCLGRPDLFRGPATKYSAEELNAILHDETTPVFVCVDDSDRLVGHAFCVHRQTAGSAVLKDVRTLYVDDICVDSELRGRHIGKALYDYVIAYAREKGFYHVTLNVWACNTPALEFYKAMGMTPQKICMETVL